MNRCVVNVATGPYVKGQERLTAKLASQGGDYVHFRDCLPTGSPSHQDVPYAFKAFALAEAAQRGYTSLLWCDACIDPVKPLGPLWEQIEREGYWIARNGWNNYEWTADSAYFDLFEREINRTTVEGRHEMKTVYHLNRTIPHVVATAFGISLAHPLGLQFFQEYFRLARDTRAFCGPWVNLRTAPCGPSDVLGHRHDQTAASVIAWRLGMKLTDPPQIFAYKNEAGADERTILVADGGY